MGRSETAQTAQYPNPSEVLAVSGPDRWTYRNWLILLGMLIGLVIFYRASYQLPVTLSGLAIFFTLALLRPQLALLFVPLTVPLYFIPKAIWDARFGIRTEGIFFPLHEVVLLITFGATAFHWLMLAYRERRNILATMRDRATALQSHIRPAVMTFVMMMAPLVLFFLAGTIGVLVALPEGRGAALRTWRWMVIEPLMFLVLMRFFLYHAPVSLRLSRTSLLASFVVGGAVVGGIGLLQWGGINLVPLLGGEVGFSDDTLLVEGVKRASSVYGHPNNLGLYMGRIWPIAAVLAFSSPIRKVRLFFAVCAMVAIGGLLVSFSKGALLGAVVAIGILVIIPTAAKQTIAIKRIILISASVFLVIAVLLILVHIASPVANDLERLNMFGETSNVRIKTWHSALAMIRDHPIFGVGLDQFLLHYPDYIAESLKQTNEQYTSHPHNILLDLWLNTGIIGLVAFGWLIIRFFRVVLWDKIQPEQPERPEHQWLSVGAGAAMGAALTHGLVDQFYFVPDLAFAFWLLIGHSVIRTSPPGKLPFFSPPTGPAGPGRWILLFLCLLLVPLLVASGKAYLPPESRTATGPERHPNDLPVPSFGVNAHLATRHPDPSTMNVPGGLLQELGISWVREDFHWYRIEPQPGQWDWLFNDVAVQELTYRHINILGVIGGPSPPWATPYEGDAPQFGSFYAPDTAAFVAFAREVVTRYHPHIKYWEIWNEPDNVLFWRPHPDPVAYADLLTRTSAVIRAIDPEARLLIGGLNPYDQQFLRTVLAAGAWDSFDILAIHPYVDPHSPETAKIATAIDLVRVITAPYESLSPDMPRPRPVWVTEVGWASGPGDHDRQGLTDASMQANYLVRSMLLLWESGIERIFWYTLKDDPGNPYGLMEYGEGRADYRWRKPAFFAFKTLNAQLMHTRFVERRDLLTATTLFDFHSFGRWLRSIQPNGTIARSETGLARITYHFSTAENDYVVFKRAEPLPIPGEPQALGMWVYGDGSGHQLRLWLRDAEDEVLQITLGTVGPAGWQFLASPLAHTITEADVIANRGNQKVDVPAEVIAIVLDDYHNQYRGWGTIFLDDITAIYGQEIYDYQFLRASPDAQAYSDERVEGVEMVQIIWSPPPTWVALRTAGEHVRFVDVGGNEQKFTALDGLFGFMAGAAPSYIWHTPHNGIGAGNIRE